MNELQKKGEFDFKLHLPEFLDKPAKEFLILVWIFFWFCLELLFFFKKSKFEEEILELNTILSTFMENLKNKNFSS